MTSMDAGPGEWPLTAVVLVDLMPRLLKRPLAPRPGADVLRSCLALASYARTRGGHVVWVRTDRPVATQPPGSHLDPAVIDPADLLVTKRTVGAFSETTLQAQLAARGVVRLVLAGVMTNLGVESTARTAGDLGYWLVFVEDAMAAMTAPEHYAAVELNLPHYGKVERLSCLLAGSPFAGDRAEP